jgi:hypothetical protein
MDHEIICLQLCVALNTGINREICSFYCYAYWAIGCKYCNPTPFVSFQVREYVPDLARSLAGLVMSSDDSVFQDECMTLLGLGSVRDISEAEVKSCICEKMTRIIEMNDTKDNAEDSAPYLFECERLDEDGVLFEEDGSGDLVFDF